MKFHRILKHAPNCAGRTRCEKGNAASDVATLSGARRRRGVGSTKSVWRATRFTRKTSSPAERKVWLPVYCFNLTVLVSSQLAPSTSQQSGNHWSQFLGAGQTRPSSELLMLYKYWDCNAVWGWLVVVVVVVVGGGGGVTLLELCKSVLYFISLLTRPPLFKRIWAFWRKHHGEGIQFNVGRETWKVSKYFHLSHACNIVILIISGK